MRSDYLAHFAVGACLVLAACTDTPKVAENQLYTGSTIIDGIPIAPPDSTAVWGFEVSTCLNKPLPNGVRWYETRFPQMSEVHGDIAGWADADSLRVFLRDDWRTWPLYEIKRVVKHELTHIIGGWKANHSYQVGYGVITTEPTSYFKARCGNQ